MSSTISPTKESTSIPSRSISFPFICPFGFTLKAEHFAPQDTVEREAMISQVRNYGQTPSQLFTKAHPKRRTAFLPRPTDPSRWIPAAIAGWRALR